MGNKGVQLLGRSTKNPPVFCLLQNFSFQLKTKKPSCFLLPSSPCTPPRTWSAATRQPARLHRSVRHPLGCRGLYLIIMCSASLRALDRVVRRSAGAYAPFGAPWPQRPRQHGAWWPRCASVHSLALVPVCFAATYWPEE